MSKIFRKQVRMVDKVLKPEAECKKPSIFLLL